MGARDVLKQVLAAGPAAAQEAPQSAAQVEAEPEDGQDASELQRAPERGQGQVLGSGGMGYVDFFFGGCAPKL